MKRFGPSKWLSSLMLIWGIIMMLMSLVRNSTDLLAARFFLVCMEIEILFRV